MSFADKSFGKKVPRPKDVQFPVRGLKEMNPEEDKGLFLVHHLKDCANFTESFKSKEADISLFHLSNHASPIGDSIERVATYFSEALAFCHVSKHLRGVPKILHLSKKLSTQEQLLVYKLFYQLYPFLNISHAITNHTIIEAMKQENEIHILDLSACDSMQWISFMRSLKECLLQNQPCMKITITCINEKKEVLDQMELELEQEAKRLNFDFQFNPIESSLENLDFGRLLLVKKKGEALAISCVLQLHSLLAIDEDVLKNSPTSSRNQRIFYEILLGNGNHKNKKILGQTQDPGSSTNKINLSPDSTLSRLSSLCPSPKMECFLNGLWKLQPKVMVVTEHESNINGGSLTERVDKALHFFAAMFDCLESSSISRSCMRRTFLEKMLLGEKIKNIITCEGVERKERYEKLETWITRLELAGFRNVPLSSYGIMQAPKLLKSYVSGYHIAMENKCLFMCWENMPLFSISAWEF